MAWNIYKLFNIGIIDQKPKLVEFKLDFLKNLLFELFGSSDTSSMVIEAASTRVSPSMIPVRKENSIRSGNLIKSNGTISENLKNKYLGQAL